MNWSEQRKRKARRRLARRAAVLLLGVLAAASLLGLALASEQVVTGHAVLDRPPEAVWRVLLDLDGMPLWRSDLRALERLPDQNGRRTWREIAAGETRVMEIAAAEPPTRLVLRRADAGIPGLPLWTIELAPAARGTRVTLSERMRVGNPVRRVYYRLRPPRAALGRFLRDLELRLTAGRREVVNNPGADARASPRLP